ncbi:MAG: sn-glycerol-3-phosphate ABC transporter ATP-binding protein UgpC [Alphaproteobacteria bacterium]
MASVSIRNVAKSYGKTEVIRGLNLEIAHDEFVVLVGPSGCGKSTILRMIAGLEEITDGEILIGDRVVNTVEPKNRNIAMVFQNYALYPHMTVHRNIAFGLRAAKLPKPEIDRKVREAAGILGLTDLMNRRPAELSGGQRQRVSMGRAIVRDPQVFLFDEPLSNLDAKLRTQMRTEIKKLHQKVRTTVVYVTHDQIEAMTLADRIVILRDGLIQQVGTPLEVYQEPANVFVAGFIGSPAMNLVPCRLIAGDGGLFLQLGAKMRVPVPERRHAELRENRPVIMGIRPDDLVLVNARTDYPAAWLFDTRITVVEPMGSESILFLDIAGQEMVGKAEGRTVPKVGEPARVAVNLEHLHIFDPDSERSIY